MPKLRRSPALAVAALLVTCPALGQGAKEDYARIETMRAAARTSVFRTRVQPHWFAGGRRFWYRNDLAAGRKEFVLVDAQAGGRALAFDHKRLATAMATALGKPVDAAKLPFDAIALDDACTAVTFGAGGKTWRCSLTDYTLAPATGTAPEQATLPRSMQVRPSSRTGDESAILFQNRTSGPISLFWIDSEGGRKAYGTLAAGESREQHSFAGHVWLATDAAGKTLGVYEAADSPGTAVIDGSAPQRTSGRPRGRGEQTRQAEPGRSPDDKWIAFVRDANVWLRDAATGAETALSADGKLGDAYGEIVWAPDSQRLVAVRTLAGEEHKVYIVQSSPPDQVQPKLLTLDYHKPGDKLPVPTPHLFDVTARREIPVANTLFPHAWSVSDIRWDADSSRFTFVYNQRGHQVLRIVAVDAASGAATAIVDETSKTFIDYAGKHFCRYLDATSEILWMSERDGWNHLYLIDSRTGAVKSRVTQGAWVVRSVERVDEAKREVWFSCGGIDPAQDPYYLHQCRVGFDGKGLLRLTSGDGNHALTDSPDGEFYLDAYSRTDMPPVTELRRTRDGSPVCLLERGDASALLKAGWKMPERFAAKGRDGLTDIYGVIYRPSNFRPGKRYPVIESIYAGPQGFFTPKGWSAWNGMQELAELGFIVVQMDGMGTSGRSKAFHDVCARNLGDAGFPDRILWMQAAAKTRPWMDLTRVGIYGGSAGGQNALRGLETYPDFYKAAVADCGCHDNRMDKVWWNELWMGWPVGPHYAEQSNVTNAKNIKGKLLLIVGEMDTNVDPASTMQVVDALIKADKDFDLLVVPNGGHCPSGTPYGTRRLRDFFVRALWGSEPRR
jgi:dipeptidyl aminopeptidase/acylaminoacyl peptidase